AAEDQGEGSAIPAEPQHTPTDPVSSTSQPTIPSTNEPLLQHHHLDEATTTSVRVGTEGATTTTSGLDAGLDSGNIHESPLRELMVLVPKLVTRIANLEKELHQTKTSYRKAVLTLVEMMKSLEVALKRKTKKMVVSISEDEETKNQGRKVQDIDDDPLVSLVKSIEKDISTDLDADIEVNPGSEDFNTGNEDFNTEAMRLQALQEEEAARQVHLDALLAKRISEEEELSEQQKKRTEVQEAAQYYTKED
ncbi:hypothetical protein Tco_0842612, partial [Tanacetum coccineum]